MMKFTCKLKQVVYYETTIEADNIFDGMDKIKAKMNEDLDNIHEIDNGPFKFVSIRNATTPRS